ncbi:Dph6-related ATP pyrophosphatase [Oceanobacillus salinisoli]|uniref:Dph6-related ATP pyrophosphatase n=1 Tax=Oceanobacillus salinisoli TaxID=2678611 RepID=UPI0018CC4E96|nr:hypothetical protein [Oceanobacillus salinisoli]
MKDIIVSWSGGKDSAYAIYNLKKNNRYYIRGLLSTTSIESHRLPIHEVRRELLQEQAASLGIPLYELRLPQKVGNREYEQIVGQQFDEFKKQGIYTIAYADLFLEDIKAFRNQHLKRSGMEGIYPLWKKDTWKVARDFISKGFYAIVTTVDTEKLSAEMAGMMYDESFIRSLPDYVDPCGENGEFHTYVMDGPIFNDPIFVKSGERFKTMEGRFAHAELIR